MSEKARPLTAPTMASRDVSACPMNPLDPPVSHPIAAPITDAISGPMVVTTTLSGDGSAIRSPHHYRSTPRATISSCSKQSSSLRAIALNGSCSVLDSVSSYHLSVTAGRDIQPQGERRLQAKRESTKNLSHRTRQSFEIAVTE